MHPATCTNCKCMVSSAAVIYHISTSMQSVISGGKQESLAVCYLRHAFALGEHYNSVVPAAGSQEDAEEPFEDITSS